eukprot:802072-Pelagomonas_calceolata.AAC.1
MGKVKLENHKGHAVRHTKITIITVVVVGIIIITLVVAVAGACSEAGHEDGPRGVLPVHGRRWGDTFHGLGEIGNRAGQVGAKS